MTRAAGEIAPTASAAAPSASALPPLPKLAAITSPEPDPEALQELDRLLSQLTSEDERSRTGARHAIEEVSSPALVPAIRHRIQEIRGALDRDAAPRVIEAARKAGRKAMKSKSKDEGGKAKDEKSKRKSQKADDEAEGDWLDFLLATPHPKDQAWRDVVRLIAMERMLAAVGSTPAVREMISLHSYFGELLRIDLQRQIVKLHDKAVPALLEARQHDAKIVQRWANKMLDVLGRAIPGETVATNDTQILADVLRAYGRMRDVDALRVILSFCNSDRVQLRDAAREAVAAIGEPGIWQLREQYLNLTGNKPPRDWSWDRIARELFGLYDRARLAEVYRLMDEGLAARQNGKLIDAIDAFDKVLARSPLFERRSEMVAAYVERATQLEAEHADEALAMMRKALRLDPKGESTRKIETEIAYLEGVVSVERGSPDKSAFRKALELEPSHERARQSLSALEDKIVERKSRSPRYFTAAGIGIAALLAMLLLGWRRSDRNGPPPTNGGPGPSGSTSPLAEAEAPVDEPPAA